MIYYVNVPVYISKDAPERARSATQLCSVAVEARSETDALSKFSDALTTLVLAAAVRRAHEHTPLKDDG